ncbi:MAG: YggS family pyridoxal phosphate-dependent enzyme [Weeksellaceae bacterium]
METMIQNLQKIEQRIQSACERSNRKRDEVSLLLATKTVDSERIKKAFDAGYTLIAENKIQEVKEKYDDLKNFPHISHFIGHLQTNKVKEILRYDVKCIESVDRLKLAKKLQNRLVYEDKTMDVLIQVNTSFEESKFGISPQNALDLVREVSKMDRIRIKGLMTIGLFSAETEKVRKCFKLLKEIQNQIIQENIKNVEMKELSMGMSGDLEVAIEEGSTIVRVGTAVFGKRPYPDSYYWNE